MAVKSLMVKNYIHVNGKVALRSHDTRWHVNPLRLPHSRVPERRRAPEGVRSERRAHAALGGE